MCSHPSPPPYQPSKLSTSPPLTPLPCSHTSALPSPNPYALILQTSLLSTPHVLLPQTSFPPTSPCTHTSDLLSSTPPSTHTSALLPHALTVRPSPPPTSMPSHVSPLLLRIPPSIHNSDLPFPLLLTSPPALTPHSPLFATHSLIKVVGMAIVHTDFARSFLGCV